MPILNYLPQNSMRVIDKSHKIPDNKIKTKKLLVKNQVLKDFLYLQIRYAI